MGMTRNIKKSVRPTLCYLQHHANLSKTAKYATHAGLFLVNYTKKSRGLEFENYSPHTSLFFIIMVGQ